MPRIKKSKFDALPESDKQSIMKAGINVYDDSGSASAENDDVSHEDVYPAATNVPQQTGPTRQHMLEIAKQNTPRVAKFLGRHILEEGGKMAASVGAGRLAARLPLPPWLKVPAVLAAEGLGQGGAEVGRQWIRQDPLDLTRARNEGLAVAGTGALMAGGGAAVSRAGGVAWPAIKEAAVRPWEILRKVRKTDYWGLFKDIGQSFRKQAGIKTEGRQAMESLMADAESAGRKINGSEMVDAVIRQIRGGSEKGLVMADRQLYQLAQRMQAQIDSVAPDGWLTPSQFDDMLRQNFTTRVQEWSMQPGGGLYAERLADARNEIAEHFFKEIGPGMGEAAGRAETALGIRETAENLLPMGQATKPALGTATKLRGAMGETNIGGIGIEETLAAYDMKYGTNFAQRMRDLSLSESFYPLGERAAQEVPVFASIGRAPRGIVEAATVRLGGMLLKQGVTNPKLRSLATSILFDAASRQQRDLPGESP